MSPPLRSTDATSSAQKNDSPVVVRGYTMERAIPALLNGLPTSVLAYCSITCSARLLQPRL